MSFGCGAASAEFRESAVASGAEGVCSTIFSHHFEERIRHGDLFSCDDRVVGRSLRFKQTRSMDKREGFVTVVSRC